MATKLKSSRRFAILLMSVIVFLSACFMVANYSAFDRNDDIRKKVEVSNLLQMADTFAEGTYFIYNQAYEKISQTEMLNNYDMDDFMRLRNYVDYEVFDKKGEPQIGDLKSSDVKMLASNKLYHALKIQIKLDEDGLLDKVDVKGTSLGEKICIRLKGEIQDWYNSRLSDGYNDIYEEMETFYDANPKGVTIVYGMSEMQLKSYMETVDGSVYGYVYELVHSSTYATFQWGLVLFVLLAGVLIAWNKEWRLHELKGFQLPIEIIALGWFLAYSMRVNYALFVWNAMEANGNDSIETVKNVVMWVIVFGVVMWGAVCLQEMFVLKRAYLKKRSLIVRLFSVDEEERSEYGEKMKKGANDAAGLCKRVGQRVKHYFEKVYDEFMHMDLQEDSNKMIIKAVALNFVLLSAITCFWVFGIVALLFYSLLLFVILRKYTQDLKKKYALLLESTNLLAEGNLDAPIDGDFGVFNPMKTEIQKIQKGFKKAVLEEVKSERMKTELVTNVSHDLKTPLTAIITYVDLLKSEKDPEKRKEYLEILEKKSLRLKVLIEDLFEISKATSKNVTMNFMDVDIVGLLKQAAFECDEKIKAADLDFKWTLPSEKVVMMLDSQKTYRIFENLIVNITKYAMPHTRVYVELCEEDAMVRVSMKNISATEMNFKAEEITDRFVRGDLARNTEGSGLGLAIAKSFVELQYGTMQISTEADLFKVEIQLPKRMNIEVAE